MEIELQRWVSEKLISLLGYSQKIVVYYVIALSKHAVSPADLAGKLAEVGLPPSGEIGDFAEEIFGKVPRKSSGPNSYQENEREARILARKQRNYRIIEPEEDEEDEKAAVAEESIVGGLGLGLEEKKPIEEKVKNSNNVEALRRASREEYLKKREKKKLEEIRDAIEDEEQLFQGMKLTDSEIKDSMYKKQVYEIVKKRSRVAYEEDDDMGEYRMPESYDRQGAENQARRFSVRKQDWSSAGDDKNPQMAWEEYQVKKATLRFGSKNRKPIGENYDYIFDCLDYDINKKFTEGPVIDADKFEEDNNSLTVSMEEKEALPIYAYKDKLLEAIRDHQIIIIVGETGSGKTTQIPQYLHEAGYTRYGIIGCTQPRRIASMSVASRVAREMGVKLGREVGYSVRFEDCTSERTVIKYMTDGMLLRELLSEPDLARYSVLIVDEAHERTVSTDILFGLVKDIARYRPDLKVLISSATLDAVKFSNFFDCAPIFKIPGRRYPVEILYSKVEEPDYLDAVLVTVLQIHVSQPAGDILVFLTGQDEIEKAEEMLKHRMRVLGSKIAELIICPVYGNLPSEDQVKIFKPTPKGARKVVLATNIAETSLTINGISYVVDTGFCKTKYFTFRSGMDALRVELISKASAMQRAGRAGRTSPGKCFRLYTSHCYKNDMPESTIPEIQRTDLANVVLTLKTLGIDDLNGFDFMDAPPTESLLKAMELLYALNALNNLGKLTKIGEKMAEFPLDPMLSKMLVESDRYKCSSEIATIAAMLSVGYAIFYSPKNRRTEAGNAKKYFYRGNVGDHIALLNVYDSWAANDFSRPWCYANFVLFKSLKLARDIREQLVGLLGRVGIELSSSPDDTVAINKAVTSGFFTHCAKLQKDGSYRTLKYPQTVLIHPTSGLSKTFPKWVIYHELVLTKEKYIRQVSEFNVEWLSEIAPHYYELKELEEPRPKMLRTK